MTGRPRAFENVEQLQKGIDSYIEESEEKGRPLNMSRLAMHLGIGRSTLFEYANGKYGDEFRNTIKKAVQLIEAEHVEGLLTGKLNTAGVIFTLKNNHGWTDRQYIESTGETTKTVKLDEATRQALADGIRAAITGQ